MSRFVLASVCRGIKLHQTTIYQQKSLTRQRRRTVFTFGSKPDDGVTLQIGSFTHRMHQMFRSFLSQGMVFHVGKLLTIFSTVISDYSGVRLALFGSAMCSTTFHFLFPDPRPVRMFYGFIFALGNAYAMFIYSLENSNFWTIQDERTRQLYEQYLKPAGFTVYHMQRIIDDCDGEEISVKKGEYLVKQDDKMEYFYIITGGNIEFHKRLDKRFHGSHEGSNIHVPDDVKLKLFKTSHIVGYGTHGTIVGEVFDPDWDPDIDHYWVAGAYCTEDATFLKIDRRKYRKYALDHNMVRRASSRLTIKDLWRNRRATGIFCF